MEARVMRLLRMKHRITRKELGDACRLSAQRISELELGTGHLTPETCGKVRSAFETVIDQREAALTLLWQDYQRYRGELLTPVEETEYEL